MEQNEFRTVSAAKNYLEEKFEIESAFDISEHGVVEDTLSVTEVGDKVIIACLKYDQDPMDYFSNDDGAGELFQFRNVDERDSKAKELKKDKKLFYLVDKYDHSAVHFSVSQTANYPDQRWDVSHGCAIYVPCDYIQSEYKKLAKKEGVEAAKSHFIKDSNSVLDEYSNWCNGEVYGYSVTIFDKKGEEINCDECWGFIGQKYAEEEKKSVEKHYVDKEFEAVQEKKVKATLSKNKNPAQMDLFENNDNVVANPPPKKKKM